MGFKCVATASLPDLHKYFLWYIKKIYQKYTLTLVFIQSGQNVKKCFTLTATVPVYYFAQPYSNSQS